MTSLRARDRLIEKLAADGIQNPRVLEALRQVPRHLFVDEGMASHAYDNTALPIGRAQTISQPWVVARMTEAALQAAKPGRVLEIGTGSGYQAAVLAEVFAEVYTLERIGELLRIARRRLRQLGCEGIRFRHDDGRAGWPEAAPFDAIVVTAAGAAVPAALLDQLGVGGVLIAPVGPPTRQMLEVHRRIDEDQVETTELSAVSFVPLLAGLD